MISVAALAICVAGLATVAPQAQTRPWAVGDVFVGVGSDLVPNGKYLVFDKDGTYRETLVDTTTQYPITTGCMVRPFAVAGDNYGESLLTTNFFGSTRNGWGFYPAGPDALNTAVGPNDPPYLGFNFAQYYDATPDYGPTVTRFDATTHAAGTMPLHTITQPNVMATESVVFDKQGNYYVGGIVGPFADENPFGYIFKYSALHQLVATYAVPNGKKGADWIDLGADGRTLYYTSEGNAIHKYVPDDPATVGVVETAHAVIQVPVHAPIYAFRLLPALPNSTEPSGFLVATAAGVIRLGPAVAVPGQISEEVPEEPAVYTAAEVFRYNVDVPAGTSFFALNIAPDGKSFWTATEQPDVGLFLTKIEKGKEVFAFDADGYLQPTAENPPRAYVMQFHFATGALLTGPIDLTTATGTTQNIHSAKGLCVKREFTAAFNECAVTDSTGAYVYDEAGNLVTQACPVRELCTAGSAGDDDGDGLADADDPDCVIPGSPAFRFVIPDTQNVVNDAVAGYPAEAPGTYPLATSPENLALTFTAGNLPPGLTVVDASTGRMAGTPTTAGEYTVTVVATDTKGRSAKTTFKWKVLAFSGNLPPTLFPATASPTGHPDPFTVTVLRPHQLTLKAKDGDGIWVAAAYRLVGGTFYQPGLPPGYSLQNPAPTFGRSPELPLPVAPGAYEFGLLGLVANADPSYMNTILLGTAPAHATVEGVYEVRIAIMDNPQGSSWGDIDGNNVSNDLDRDAQIADHAWLLPTQHQSFTISVVNKAPAYATTSIANIHQLIGTPVPLRTVVAGDPDSHYPLSFSLVNGPAGTSVTVTATTNDAGGNIISQTGTFAGAPQQELNNGLVAVVVNDLAGKPAATSLSLTWNVFNTAPTINPVANQSTLRGATISPLQVTGSDPDYGAPGDKQYDPLLKSTVNQTLINWSDGGTLPPGLSINPATGVITGVPTASGVYNVAITVTDGWGKQSLARTFVWTVVNNPPTAQPGSNTTPEDTPVSGTLTAADSDSDTLTFTLGTNVQHGSVVVGGNGSYTYTPALNYNGPDSFTFSVNDGNGGTATSTVTLTVTPVNDPPDAKDGVNATSIGVAVGGTAIATDADGDALIFSGSGATPNGSVIVNANGTYTYTPAPGFSGTDTFTFTVSDGKGGTDTAAIAITVSGNAPRVCLAAAPSQPLWPPNHKLVEVSILNVTNVTITGIRQDEPVKDLLGSGHTIEFDAAIGEGGGTAWLRAERTGVRAPGVNAVPGNGRIYEIFFTATDALGACQGMVTVGIPHDMGQPGARMPYPNPGRWNSLNGDPVGGTLP